MQRQVQESEEDAKNIEIEFEHYKHNWEQEKKRIREMKNETKKKKETLIREIQCINEDYKATYAKKEDMEREMEEIIDNIKDVNEDISKKEEEQLKVRIKMR